MQESNNRKEKKLSKTARNVWCTLTLLWVILMMNGYENAITVGLLAVLCVTGGIAALVLFFADRRTENKGGTEKSRAFTLRPDRQHDQPKSYNPEVLRDRDSLRRLEQLDSFLANGLIDKKEYTMLRAKYEKAAKL